MTYFKEISIYFFNLWGLSLNNKGYKQKETVDFIKLNFVSMVQNSFEIEETGKELMSVPPHEVGRVEI